MFFRSVSNRADQRTRAAMRDLQGSTVRRSLTRVRRTAVNPDLRDMVVRRLRSISPIVSYRTFALLLALALVATPLHRDSSLRHDWPVAILALLHLIATMLAAPNLPRRSDRLNLIVIAIDIFFCALLVALSYGSRGPYWLYAVSGVFWPSHRFGLRGALLGVLAFDFAVLMTGFGRTRQAFQEGFGGDFVARQLIVLLVAGAVSLTSRALAQVTAMAAESERHRIARDLHDGVGKTLGGISLEAGSLAWWIERDPVEARRRARYVARISERAAMDVRDVIRTLRQRESTVPLLPEVEKIVAEWDRGHGASVQLRLSGPNVEIPILIRNEILRLLSELLENVARHAQARHIWVRVTLSSTGVTLAVRDDGIGFEAHRLDPWAGEGHFGLLGARERVSMLGGLFQLHSLQGHGTEVTIDLPLANRDERLMPAR